MTPLWGSIALFCFSQTLPCPYLKTLEGFFELTTRGPSRTLNLPRSLLPLHQRNKYSVRQAWRFQNAVQEQLTQTLIVRLLTNTIIFVVLKIRKGSGPPTQPPCHTWRENILRFSHVSQKFIYLTTTYRQSVRVSDCALRSSLASATVRPRHPSSLQVETQAVGYALQLCPVSLGPEKTVHNSIIEMTLKLNRGQVVPSISLTVHF